MQTFNKALNNMPIITREQYVVIAYDQLHFFFLLLTKGLRYKIFGLHIKCPFIWIK